MVRKKHGLTNMVMLIFTIVLILLLFLVLVLIGFLRSSLDVNLVQGNSQSTELYPAARAVESASGLGLGFFA